MHITQWHFQSSVLLDRDWTLTILSLWCGAKSYDVDTSSTQTTPSQYIYTCMSSYMGEQGIVHVTFSVRLPNSHVTHCVHYIDQSMKENTCCIEISYTVHCTYIMLLQYLILGWSTLFHRCLTYIVCMCLVYIVFYFTQTIRHKFTTPEQRKHVLIYSHLNREVSIKVLW